MKKQYMCPKTTIVIAYTEHLLQSASGTGIKGTASSGNLVLSRESGGFWDEVDDDF